MLESMSLLKFLIVKIVATKWKIQHFTYKEVDRNNFTKRLLVVGTLLTVWLKSVWFLAPLVIPRNHRSIISSCGNVQVANEGYARIKKIAESLYFLCLYYLCEKYILDLFSHYIHQYCFVKETRLSHGIYISVLSQKSSCINWSAIKGRLILTKWILKSVHTPVRASNNTSMLFFYNVRTGDSLFV